MGQKKHVATAASNRPGRIVRGVTASRPGGDHNGQNKRIQFYRQKRSFARPASNTENIDFLITRRRGKR